MFLSLFALPTHEYPLNKGLSVSIKETPNLRCLLGNLIFASLNVSKVGMNNSTVCTYIKIVLRKYRLLLYFTL